MDEAQRVNCVPWHTKEERRITIEYNERFHTRFIPNERVTFAM